HPPPLDSYTLSLHDALPILGANVAGGIVAIPLILMAVLSLFRWLSWHPLKCFKEPMIWGLHTSYLFIILGALMWAVAEIKGARLDRKSTRLNSSHVSISYAV